VLEEDDGSEEEEEDLPVEETAGMADRVWEMTRIMIDEEQATPMLERRVREIVAASIAAADIRYGKEEAIAWGDGYRVPVEIVKRDEDDLARCGYDLQRLVEERKAKMAKDRLSAERVERLSPDNPEREHLLKLVEGMPVLVAKDFKPNGDNWPRRRKDYEEVHCAVDKCFMEAFADQGLAIVLSEATVRERFDDTIHMSVAGWAEKYGKLAGRPITDCTSGEGEGRSVLNTKEAKELCDEIWGEIIHPTLTDLVQMVLEMQDQPEHVGGKGLMLWATDVASAYTKLFFRSEDVKWMAVSLVSGLVVFFIAGIFGWTGTPAAFAVVTRALEFEMKRRLPGRAKMYVDDTMGCCAQDDVATSVEGVRAFTCDLLGPDALSDEKTRHAREMDMIGWHLNLDTQRVTIARKNVLRAIYGFFLVGDNKDGRVPVRTLERLASWGSRYGEICVGMKPYVNVLYAAYKGCNRKGNVEITPQVRQICRLFQVLLVLSAVDELEFSRPFHTFAKAMRLPTVVIECDASLTGGGGMIMIRNEDGTETVVGCFTVDLTSLGFGTDSSFQNVAEFIVAVVAIRAAKRMGMSVTRVHLRLDSKTALSWSQRKFRGVQVSAAACVYCFMLAAYGIEWVSDEHLKGTLNTRADKLSRGARWQDMQREYPELRGVPLFRGEDDSGVARLLKLCDPRKDTSRADALLAREWRDIRALLQEELR
jgi:hypothetical protein